MNAELTEIHAIYTCPKGHRTETDMYGDETKTGNIPTAEVCEECD